MRFPATLQCDIDGVGLRRQTALSEIPNRQGGKLHPGKVSKVPQELILASFVGDQSVGWLRGYKEDKPFSLWVSFID